MSSKSRSKKSSSSGSSRRSGSRHSSRSSKSRSDNSSLAEELPVVTEAPRTVSFYEQLLTALQQPSVDLALVVAEQFNVLPRPGVTLNAIGQELLVSHLNFALRSKFSDNKLVCFLYVLGCLQQWVQDPQVSKPQCVQLLKDLLVHHSIHTDKKRQLQEEGGRRAETTVGARPSSVYSAVSPELMKSSLDEEAGQDAEEPPSKTPSVPTQLPGGFGNTHPLFRSRFFHFLLPAPFHLSVQTVPASEFRAFTVNGVEQPAAPTESPDTEQTDEDNSTRQKEQKEERKSSRSKRSNTDKGKSETRKSSEVEEPATPAAAPKVEPEDPAAVPASEPGRYATFTNQELISIMQYASEVVLSRFRLLTGVFRSSFPDMATPTQDSVKALKRPDVRQLSVVSVSCVTQTGGVHDGLIPLEEGVEVPLE